MGRILFDFDTTSSDSPEGTGSTGDILLAWSNSTADADAALDGTDLAADQGLATAVLMSLFLDRRAEADDVPPSGDPSDRRGWWADEFAVVEGDRIGSRLWLLDRSTNTNDAALRAKEYVTEALAWMIADKVVASVDVTVSQTPTGLLIELALQNPGRDPTTFRFAHVWDHATEDF